MPKDEAEVYFAPYNHLYENIGVRRDTPDGWWLLHRPRRAMRRALAGLSRYIATSSVSKYRVFDWVDGETLPDHALIVFASDDDYLLGILQSKVHEAWSLANGSQHTSVPRYTHTTCFETFPFPNPPDAVKDRIRDAADRLVKHRNDWKQERESQDKNGPVPSSLSALYGENSRQLRDRHAELDAAVFAAYGWDEDPATMPEDLVLARLLELNLGREGV